MSRCSTAVWLVFHHKKPHYHSGFGNVYYHPGRPRGPSYYDTECVGIYSTEEAADCAAKEYFLEELGLEEGEDREDNEECSGLGRFQNGVEAGEECHQQVYVEQHTILCTGH